MRQITLGISLVILIFILFQLYWRPVPVPHPDKDISLSKEISLSEHTPIQSPKSKETSYKTDPKILWASDNVKYWVYDEADIDPQKWDTLWAKHFNEIRQFTAFNKDFLLELFAYPSVERKAIRTHNMRVAHTADSQVHLVSNTFFKGENWGEQYRPLIRAALKDAPHDALETGLAMQWCKQIRGQDIIHWVARLVDAKALPKLATLYNKIAFKEAPPIAARLAAASWVTYCLERWGREWFLAHYQSSGSPNAATLAQWDSDWQEWIVATAPLSVSKIRSFENGRLNGFTLAHEGYRIYNGYGGTLAQKSLEYLADLGTNAIAIVPYSYMRSANKPSPIPVMDGPGVENDEAVLFAHFSAKSLKQFTLLKPQIWLHDSWPGDIDFKDEQSWQAFFAYYRIWIMHYALLAEMNGFDALCIGTEFRHATIKYPDYWQTLIKDIRKLYHGSLTYAANWGEECEKITFWDRLDFIGINCYYPLYKQDDASEADLRQGMKRNLAKIKRIHDEYEQPVWLTEVGFRSAKSPWVLPHAAADSRIIDNQAQALCYEVLLSELAYNEWVTAMFWWKWPTNLNHNEDQGRGYMPLKKPAEKVLRKYFTADRKGSF